MSASSSAIQPAISSAVNTRGSGSAAPSARSREARKSINSCFSAGESETAAASISASVTIRTSVHASKAIRKAYVPRPRANAPNHFLAPACSFLRVSGCVGFCVALLRAPSFSSGKTEVCVILLGELSSPGAAPAPATIVAIRTMAPGIRTSVQIQEMHPGRPCPVSSGGWRELEPARHHALEHRTCFLAGHRRFLVGGVNRFQASRDDPPFQTGGRCSQRVGEGGQESCSGVMRSIL